MDFDLSLFGKKLSSHSGILALMDDLGNALSGNTPMIMMGGGNPAHIPEVQALFRDQLSRILADPGLFSRLIGNYDTSQGNAGFISSLAAFLRLHYGWNITERNIAVTNGSQNAFFLLFNLLAGDFGNGKTKKILFPLCPEYIGYSDQGITPNMFVSQRPLMEHLDRHTFKYHIDFDSLTLSPEIAALCVSRPTNPTGNVLTDSEISRLSQLSKDNNIPLIIDNAYGLPFPGIIFTEANLHWEPHIVLSMSLSKLGLPSARNGIIVADEALIEIITRVNAVTNLATGSIGQYIITPLLDDNSILTLSTNTIRPFYQKRSEDTIELASRLFSSRFPWHMHVSEGALFLWLWFPELPVTSQKLYELLKAKGVLVIPGHYFFPGLPDDWEHSRQCIRLTYSQDPSDIKKGISIMADLLDSLHSGEPHP